MQIPVPLFFACDFVNIGHLPIDCLADCPFLPIALAYCFLHLITLIGTRWLINSASNLSLIFFPAYATGLSFQPSISLRHTTYFTQPIVSCMVHLPTLFCSAFTDLAAISLASQWNILPLSKFRCQHKPHSLGV
jgi:hypothetical protein